MSKPLTFGYIESYPFSMPEDFRLILWGTRLRGEVRKAYDLGCTRFLCGGGPYGDLYFAEGVLDLRESGLGVDLTMLLPSANYTADWPEDLRERQRYLVGRADHLVFFPPGPDGRWSEPSMIRRGADRWVYLDLLQNKPRLRTYTSRRPKLFL